MYVIFVRPASGWGSGYKKTGDTLVNGSNLLH